MTLSEPFIRRPVGTSLLAIGLFLSGLVAYRLLPVAPLPRMDFPMIMVSASLPGADPATVASSLAAPLERRLGQIAGLNEMTSISTLGGTSITMQFDLNRNVDRAARDVQAAISASAADLPSNLPTLPNYRKLNPADSPIMILAMTSTTLTAAKLYEQADEIVAQRLSQIEGVSQVFVGGAARSAVRVQVNPSALASSGLGFEEVRGLISRVNEMLPRGSVEGPRTSEALTSNGQLMEAAPYDSLILTQKNLTPVRINAIGDAVDGSENDRVAGWAGAERATVLVVFKQPGANVIDTIDKIKEVLPRLSVWLPP